MIALGSVDITIGDRLSLPIHSNIIYHALYLVGVEAECVLIKVVSVRGEWYYDVEESSI
jgi:hypothetical protein